METSDVKVDVEEQLVKEIPLPLLIVVVFEPDTQFVIVPPNPFNQ